MTEEKVQMGHDLPAHWQRLYEGTRQMLARALYENRVHTECLEIAMKVLRRYTGDMTAYCEFNEALARIAGRLAELETDSD